MNEGINTQNKTELQNGAFIGLSLIFSVIYNSCVLFSNNSIFFDILSSVLCLSFSVILMSAGAILMSEDKWLSVKNVYKKLLPALLIPTAIWTVIYAGFNIWYKDITLNDAVSTVLKAYAQPVSFHLWLPYCLIAFCIILPLINLFVRKANNSLIFYAVVIWAISGVILPFLASAHPFFTLTHDADINVYYGYIGFFLFGYYINKKDFKINLLIPIIILIICCVLNTFLVFKLADSSAELSNALNNICSPLNVTSAACLYTLLKGIKSDKALNILKRTSGISFGIYFCHPLVLESLVKLFNPESILTVSLCILSALAISFIISLVIEKLIIKLIFKK